MQMVLRIEWFLLFYKAILFHYKTKVQGTLVHMHFCIQYVYFTHLFVCLRSAR